MQKLSGTHFPVFCSMLWTLLEKRVPKADLPPSLLKSLGSSFIKVLLEMRLLCGMDGNPPSSHPLVHVVSTFLWNMSFHVPKVVSPPFGTMRLETSRLI